MARVIITGANRGIGYELARLRCEDDEIIALVRKVSSQLRELNVEVVEGVDVTDGDSVDAAAARLAEVDILINNAGILEMSPLENLDFDSVRRQFEVNAIGPLRMSAAVAPRMNAGGKIAIITSRMGSLSDNTSGGAYGYRMSKCAVNMVGVSLAQDLRARDISVGILHPGYVRTEMTGGRGHIDPDEAASMLWERIDELGEENTGTFWHANGEVLGW